MKHTRDQDAPDTFEILHTFLQQLYVSHDEVQRFKWKCLQNDDVTL